MKINCLVKSSIEYEDRIDPITTAETVDPNETVGSLLDRLTGTTRRTTYPELKEIRTHDPTTCIELRVCHETPAPDVP